MENIVAQVHVTEQDPITHQNFRDPAGIWYSITTMMANAQTDKPEKAMANTNKILAKNLIKNFISIFVFFIIIKTFAKKPQHKLKQ